MPVPDFPFDVLGSSTRQVTSPRTVVPLIYHQMDSGIGVSRRRSTGVVHLVSLVYVVNCETRGWLEWHFNEAQGQIFIWRHARIPNPVMARYISDAIEFTELGPLHNGEEVFEAKFDLEIIAPNEFTIRELCAGGGGDPPPPPPSEPVHFFYLAKTLSAEESPIPYTGWNQTTSSLEGASLAIVRRKLITEDDIALDSDGLTHVDYLSGVWPDFDESRMWAQFVSAPIEGQVLSGNIVGQIQCFDSVPLNKVDPFQEDVYTVLIARLVANDGTHKAVLLNGIGLSSNGIPESNGGLSLYTNRHTCPVTAISTTVAEAGDRIVVEIGTYRPMCANGFLCADPLLGSNQYVRMRFGSKISSATNRLPIDESNVDNDKVPWIYFENGVMM